MHRPFILTSWLTCLLAVDHKVYAQLDCECGWRSFPEPQPANTVFEAIRWDDHTTEKLYLGGFTATFSGGIRSWDGYNWASLGSGIAGATGATPLVDGLAVFEDSLIVAGLFRRAGDVDAMNVARWTGVHWQPMGGGIRQGRTGLYVLHVHDGQLYAGGERLAATAGDPGAPCLHRWNGVDWDPMPVEADSAIATALISHDGALHAAVGTSTTSGPAAVYRWNGSSWSMLGGVRADGLIWALAAYQGDLIAGGSFTAFGEAAMPTIARWNGITWNGYGTVITSFFPTVYGLGVYRDELIVAGDFGQLAGNSCPNLIAFDGTRWRCFEGGTPGSFAYSILPTDGEFLVTGRFGSGAFPDNIARWGRPISPADVDQDFDVDLADLAILLSAFGAVQPPPSAGDTDADGDIDLQDLATLLAQFGESCP